MDYDYSKRSYLLPDGCKDLIDAIQPNAAITERGFVVTVQLPGRQSADIEIRVEGSILRISAKQVGSHPAFDNSFQVPSGYVVADTRATYLHGRLRIVVPEAAA